MKLLHALLCRRSKHTATQDAERSLVESLEHLRHLESTTKFSDRVQDQWSDVLAVAGRDDASLAATDLNAAGEPWTRKDDAHPDIISFRTREQMAAMTAFYLTNPSVFSTPVISTPAFSSS